MKTFKKGLTLLLWSVLFTGGYSFGQKDTLRVMAYNVLYYGNGCQGPNGLFHDYLKTIIGYTTPDIISLEKAASIPLSKDDKYGTASLGFADSILKYALNAAFPGRYAYCPFTNAAKANNMALLFYDQSKLGFLTITSSYSNITDFNTYKLYYKDPNLANTHDTTFLYVTQNHDKSGDENAIIRGKQIAREMECIKNHFTSLPNMINLGDFNVRSSREPCYQVLTAGNDSNFRFCDPPFLPDRELTYPAEWDHDGKYAAYFTTATRENETSCGSGGGAKNWYDHIFLSPWIVNNANYIRYIPHSYRTVGNDGNRFKISVNNKNIHVNTSAPTDVIEAIYRMSNKYPVMVSLEVTSNANGVSVRDPERVNEKVFAKEEISIVNPVGNELTILFPDAMVGTDITIECIDATGDVQMKKTLTVKDRETTVRCKLSPGSYTARFLTKHSVTSELNLIKE